ncbi:ABC transporter permease [Haladaptatus halobius]|uniref:ABC transporter permease n=1 Tax=Haladaptatus halobius TaxID=2884875 RepID=UPI001D09B6AE|nr:ABC transporter permease [Haladaptatus halobius]
MNGAVTVSRRLLLALRSDRRTFGLVLVVPAFIIYLLSEAFPRPEPVAPILLAVFVFFLTYLLTAVGFLREQTAGTLECILVSPISRGELVLGYVVGFGLLAAVQSVVLLGASVYFLDVEFAHGVGLFFLLSLFAENEFQALQFIPVVIAPQVILGGTFRPVEELPIFLELPARAMPITYLVDEMEYVVIDRGSVEDAWLAMGVLAVLTTLSIATAAVAVRRAD